MKKALRKTGGVALAICLAMPIAAQAAVPTKAEFLQMVQQHQSGKPVAKTTVADPTAAKRAELQARKLALIKERQKLAQQGNMAALEANRNCIAAVDAELKSTQKGVAKK